MSRRRVVLIVEDDADLGRLFRHALTSCGFDVHETGDGLSALHLVEVVRACLVSGAPGVEA